MALIRNAERQPGDPNQSPIPHNPNSHPVLLTQDGVLYLMVECDR
ncbi:MAG: hypothetical protein ACYT04_32445 [Nostoc sp.]